MKKRVDGRSSVQHESSLKHGKATAVVTGRKISSQIVSRSWRNSLWKSLVFRTVFSKLYAEEGSLNFLNRPTWLPRSDRYSIQASSDLQIGNPIQTRDMNQRTSQLELRANHWLDFDEEILEYLPAHTVECLLRSRRLPHASRIMNPKNLSNKTKQRLRKMVEGRSISF